MPIIFFSKITLKEKTSCPGQAPNQANTYSLANVVFQKTTRKDQQWQFRGYEAFFERASALVSFFKAIRLLLVFTLNASCYFIRLLWSWRVGDVTRTITIATKLTVLTYQPLFLNEHSLDCFKPLFNFWSSEKADSDIICYFLIAL